MDLTQQSTTNRSRRSQRRPNYYEILEVSPQATKLEIRETFLRLKSTYTDGSFALYSLMSEEEAQASLSKIEEAFQILNDDVARDRYDKTLQTQASPESAQPAIEASAEQAVLTETLEPKAPRFEQAKTPQNTAAQKAQNEQLQSIYLEMIAESDVGDGELLERLRSACEVSEEEMQDRTKISIGYIRALESNQYDRLPQKIYIKGFLTSYLKYLNVATPAPIIEAYMARLTDWQMTNS